MSQHVTHMVNLLFPVLLHQNPTCYVSNGLLDAAARDSTVSYYCLFSLPPFVCFVKVLLSIIMNHIFFHPFIYSHDWR